MLWNIIIFIVASFMYWYNDGIWVKIQFAILGLLGIGISVWEYNKGWNIGFNAFMKEFARNSDLSVIRDLFRKERKNEKK